MAKTKIFEKISIWSIVIFAMIMLVSCLLTAKHPTGEWDDYLYTTASLINDQNMTISGNDIDFAYKIFPEISGWSKFLGSNFVTSSGDILPWYFGTYSALCIPMVWVLNLLRLPPIHAFSLTNILIYLIALYCTYIKLKTTAKAKVILLLLLMVNPAVFYINWISAEVFIFSMVIFIMIYWTNQKYWKTALLISIASSLNPTILVLAPILTIDFVYYHIMEGRIEKPGVLISQLKRNYKSILIYFLSYSIAIIPLAYNLIYTGQINLTAGTPGFYDNHLVLARFWAYLTDLNFGFLPYFGLTFLLSLVLFVIAIYKRAYRCVLMMLGFLCTVLAYSFMAHINSCMSGIARYNCWSAPIMLFSLAVHYDQLFEKRLWKRIAEGVICISLLWSGLVVYSSGLMGAWKTSYTMMTPIARYVLTHCPSLYNPLPSTFHSRTLQEDGGYRYILPLYYVDAHDHIRKILTSSATTENVLANVSGNAEAMDYLQEKLSALSSAETYISIDQRHNLFLSKSYQLGDVLWFGSDHRNVAEYVLEGLSSEESAFAWTEGETMRIRLKVNNAPQHADYRMRFFVEKVFAKEQRVEIESDGKTIWTKGISAKGEYVFVIPNISNGVIDLTFNFPNAISPFDFNGSQDMRQLALALVSATISEEE